MRFLQPVFLVCVVLLVMLVNLLPNTAYKGMRHPVEADAVQVFAATPNAADPEVPVRRFDENVSADDTGQRVFVYLNSNYQGRELWNKPRMTLWIVGLAVPLYCLAGMATRRTPVRPSHTI